MYLTSPRGFFTPDDDHHNQADLRLTQRYSHLFTRSRTLQHLSDIMLSNPNLTSPKKKSPQSCTQIKRQECVSQHHNIHHALSVSTCESHPHLHKTTPTKQMSTPVRQPLRDAHPNSKPEPYSPAKPSKDISNIASLFGSPLTSRKLPEPVTDINTARFCLFPIKHADVWQMYKKAQASSWTGGNALL